MSPLLVFILIFSTVSFIQLHFKAGKRIRALEADLLDLQKSHGELIDCTIQLASVVDKAAEHHAEYLSRIGERIRTMKNNLEKDNEHAQRPETK